MNTTLRSKTIRLTLPEPLYRRFRVATLLEGTTMSGVLTTAIEAHVRDVRLAEEPVRTEEHAKL